MHNLQFPLFQFLHLYLLAKNFSAFEMLFLLLRFPYVVGVYNIRFLCSACFDMKAPSLSYLIFSGIPYRIKLFVKNCFTPFVSASLHIFTVGHLLKRSTAIKILTSSIDFLLWSFPVKSICISWPCSVSFFSVTRSGYSVIGILNLSVTQAMQ